MNHYTAAALQVYRRRNKELAGLGYASYEEYLASPLWAAIRDRKLAAEGRRCYACGKEAHQVHHGDYLEPTLAGPPEGITGGSFGWDRWLATAELYAVCRSCHEWAEHFLGQAVGPVIATARLKKRRKARGLDSAVPRPARQGKQERRAREMEMDLARLIARDEEE